MKEIQVSFRFTCTKRPQMPNQTTNPRRENYTETWTHSIFFWWYCCCWNASLDFFRFQFHCVHILLLFFFLLLLVVVVFLCIKRSGWRLNLSNFFVYCGFICGAWCETPSNWTGNIVFALPLPNRTYQREWITNSLRLNIFSLSLTNIVYIVECLHIEHCAKWYLCSTGGS